jgi:hypothetical protein
LSRTALTPIRTSITDFFTGRGKAVAYAGTALALAGVGTATAAAASASVTGPAPAIPTGVSHPALGAAAGLAASHSSGGKTTAGNTTAGRTTGGKTTGGKTTGTVHTALARRASTPHRARVHVVKHGPMTWKQVRDVLAGQTFPRARAGTLPLADRLEIGPASGSQAYLPITASRMANATTIVRQALAKHMGLRSAVIAVATAMQESTLENLSYGDRDSLGLFQQRPSMGWGSAAQVTDPAYAADAFLNALHGHQSADPSWAGQPLWENAQAVQESGFPYAYAQWENQAAQLVSSIARHLV